MRSPAKGELLNAFVTTEVDWPRDVAAAVAGYAGEDESIWLDSIVARSEPRDEAAMSVVAARPIAVLEQSLRAGTSYDDMQAPRDAGANWCGRAGDAVLRSAQRVLERDVSCWRLWRRVHERVRVDAAGVGGYGPGWYGYVGFEAAGGLERLPAPRPTPFDLPILRMSLYDAVVVLDHRFDRATLVAAPALADSLDVPASSVPALVRRWNAAAALTPPPAPPVSAPRVFASGAPQRHREAVRRALEYIAAGDVYQVNLAHRFDLRGLGDAIGHYVALRRANPARYAALLRWGDAAIASVSPELFLQTRGRDVLTRPIKGTRPRTGDVALDAAYRRELRESEKEAAELAMIVDLHRNDLGRVCEFGSVRVPQPRAIEAHATVQHTVADVAGRLRPDRDALDLLHAAFPAGSISGVPKIRALEIIRELEPVSRGVYTGAIGALGLHGDLTLNVAIRSLQIRGDAATLYVGGGIVA
ncbi:MAG: anthranilate synthase component I family protein, partial [Planctomycetota bacterium]